LAHCRVHYREQTSPNSPHKHWDTISWVA